MKYLPSAGRLTVLSDLRAVEMFISVVETGSLSRTADRLSVSPSTVSKKISELEGRAKVRLFNRSTRNVQTTESGRQFYDFCARIMAQIAEAEDILQARNTRPEGRIRVTAPLHLGERVLGPLIPDFLRLYPGIRLEIETSSRTLSLINEGFDLSIRITPPETLAPGARVLSRNSRVFCAAPRYLDQRGTPQHPSELRVHDCLVVSSRGLGPTTWKYNVAGEACGIDVCGSLASNNARIAADAASQGLGIVLLGQFVVDDLIASGALVRILRGFEPPDTMIAAVPSDTALAARPVSALIDYLVENWPAHADSDDA